MPWRFSFRALMTTITLLMLGFAAMVSPWPVAADFAAFACQILLCVALICAFVMPQNQKAFWIGFAVIGTWYWCSLSSADVDSSGASRGWQSANVFLSGRLYRTSSGDLVRNALPTTRVLDWLQTKMHTRLAVGSAVSAQYANGGYYPGVIDEVDGGLYLIRWTDGSSSPAQWTPPAQITQFQGNYNFRLGGHTIFCGLFGIVGGAFAMWLAGIARGKADSEASDVRESNE